jgi:hypothetical protein
MDSDNDLLRRAKRDLERAVVAKNKAESAFQAASMDVSRLQNFIEQLEIYREKSTFAPTGQIIKNKGLLITDKVVSILENAGRPLAIQELMVELERASIDVGGENKATNLAAYLSRDNRISYERGVGWRLVSEFVESPIITTIVKIEKPDSQQPGRQSNPASSIELDDDIPF